MMTKKYNIWYKLHLVKISALTALLALCIPASAQVLQPLGSGIPGKVVASFAAGEDYLALYEDTSTLEPNDFTLGHWNGLYWSFYPSLTVPIGAFTSDGVYNFHSLAYYKNEIYVGANISNATKPTDSDVTHLWKWDINSWKPVSSFTESRNDGIYAMTVFDGKLVVAGKFLDTIGGELKNNIAAFDGSNWAHIGANNSTQGTNGRIRSLLPVDNRLYIAGDFTTFAGNLTGNVAFYTKANGAVGGIGSPYSKEVTQLANVGTIIYAYGLNMSLTPEIREYKSSIWSGPIAFDSFSTANPKTIAGTTQYLLIGGDFIKNANGCSLLKYSGAKVFFTENRLTDNFMLGQRGSEAFIWGNFTETNTGIRNFSRIVPDAGNVLGTVYFDKDQDCQLDTDETGMAVATIKFTNASKLSYFVNTDEQGRFNTTLPEDFYDIRVFAGKYWVSTCESNNGVQVRNGEYSFMKLGQFVAPNKSDLTVSLGSAIPPGVKAGDLIKLVLFVKNTGSEMVDNATVHFNRDSKLQYFSSWPDPTDISGNEITYAVDNLKPRESMTIHVLLTVPADANADDEYLNRIRTGSQFTLIDIDKFDNNDTLNIKPMSRKYEGDVFKESLIGDSIQHNVRRLRYGITFTNGSTEFVKRVVIVDTLDLNMPASRLPIMETSSPFKMTSKGSNIMVLEFKDANLAARESNPAQSTGFVQYDVELWKDLNNNQNIRNMAVADFDSKFKVASNMTVVKAHDPSASTTVIGKGNTRIYPNPAIDKLNISFANAVPTVVGIYSVNGQLIREIRNTAKEMQVDLNGLAPGMYLLKAGNEALLFNVRP